MKFNLIIVINAINPDIMFPDNKENRDLKILLLKDIKKLKEFFGQNQIKYVDFNEKIEKNNRGVHFFMKPLKFSTKTTKKVRIHNVISFENCRKSFLSSV